MAATVFYRPRRRFRSPYRRRGPGTGTLAVLATVAVLASAAGAKAVAAKAGAQAGARAGHGTAAVPVSGGTEAAFFAAVLADLGATPTQANLGSLAAWAAHEGPWGSVGQWNPLDTILPMPGSWAFNSFAGGLHVQSYPTAAEGAQATALTIGGFPLITSALRSGGGVCGNGFAAEFSRWSGGGYTEVC